MSDTRKKSKKITARLPVKKERKAIKAQLNLRDWTDDQDVCRNDDDRNYWINYDKQLDW